MAAVELSVIIPVYNVAPYLRQAVDSVLAQRGVDMEILIVDDGSSDGSSAICDEYGQQQSCIRVWHQPNRGVSAARNMALSHAKGHYITFVDADDTISPGTYSPNIRYLNAHPEVMALQYPVEGKMHTTPANSGVLICGEEQLLKQWWAGSPITFSLWNKILRRNVLQGIRFLEGHVSEDTLLVATLYRRIGSLYLSPDGLYHYRERSDAYTSHYDFHKHIDLFNAHLAICRQLRLFPRLSSELVVAFTRLYRRLITAYAENPNEDITPYRRQLSDIFPSWKTLLRSNAPDKLWLATAKVLGARLFIPVFVNYLRLRKLQG